LLKNWIPLKLPDCPKKIVGRGNSPYVEYTGTGLYKLEQISRTEIKLSITKNTVIHGEINLDFFLKTSLDKPKVTLNDSPQKFKLKLKGWKKFECVNQRGKKVKVIKNSFEVKPGKIYFLNKI